MPTLKDFGLDVLNVEDRIALAEQLWESVTREASEESPAPELVAELERRVALSQAEPGRGIPFAKIRAEARKRWSK